MYVLLTDMRAIVDGSGVESRRGNEKSTESE